MKQLNLSQALLEIAKNDQRPTLEIGDKVTYDQLKDPLESPAKSLDEFKRVLRNWYNFEHTFGEDYPNSVCYYTITGVLHPSK